MLQVEMLRVRYPMRSISFLSLPNPSSRTELWGLLSLWQKWVPEAEKKSLETTARPARTAENHTAIFEPIV
jgi:hypothetical protein